MNLGRRGKRSGSTDKIAGAAWSVELEAEHPVRVQSYGVPGAGAHTLPHKESATEEPLVCGRQKVRGLELNI